MIESLWVANLVRASTIVFLALNIGFTAVVFKLYRKAIRMSPGNSGLLPWHVSAVSGGVLILQGTLAWALIEQIGRESSVEALIRIGLYGLGSAVILVSLYIIMTLQRRRVRFARSSAVTRRVEQQRSLSVDIDDEV